MRFPVMLLRLSPGPSRVGCLGQSEGPAQATRRTAHAAGGMDTGERIAVAGASRRRTNIVAAQLAWEAMGRIMRKLIVRCVGVCVVRLSPARGQDCEGGVGVHGVQCVVARPCRCIMSCMIMGTCS